MVTNLLSSLLKIQTAPEFGEISYYKVNEFKSHIINMGLDGVLWNLLELFYPYPWKDSKIDYLGIKLTNSTKHLFSINFLPFRQQFSQELEPLAKNFTNLYP